MSRLEDLHMLARKRLEVWGGTLVVEAGARTTGMRLYNEYTVWCHRSGFKPVHRTAWLQWMNGLHKRVKNNGITYYCDIKPGEQI